MIRIRSFLLLLAAWVILSSWGSVGHRKMATESVKSFNPQMEAYKLWVTDIAAHSSDADSRKSADPTESSKHYIDIDGYDEFINHGFISRSYDSLVAQYGEAFVLDQGILPWATINAFNQLVDALTQQNLGKAKLLAADLSHYVSDGFMPLHITSNYDGQFTGNKGIHSRYESDMIGLFSSQILVNSSPIQNIDDVSAYIFNYLYANYKYVDSLMIADKAAIKVNSNLKSDAYKTALWNETKQYTHQFFNEGSKAFAELFYTALLRAESVASVTQIPMTFSDEIWLTNYSGFHDESMTITYRVPQSGKVLLQVRDLSGRVVDTLVNESVNQGQHELDWNTSNVNIGIYYLVLQSNAKLQVQKVICKK